MWYLILYGVFAVWVLQDGASRKMGGSVVIWTLGTLLLGPIILPVYLAKRPLKKGEVREGGTAWNVLKNFAVLWTVLMVIAGLSAMMRVGQATSSLDSDAARAGAGLGILLGMGFLAALWFFPTLGAAVLGFLLKKNSIVETGPTGPLVGQNSEAGFANGWGGLAVCAIVVLIAVLVVARTEKASALSSAGEAGSPFVPDATTPAKSHTWELSEKSDPMDGTKETRLSLTSEDKVEGIIGSHSAYLFVRCAKGKPEVFVSLGIPVEAEYGSDTYGVRVKFNDEAAEKSRWNASTDREALFAPAPTKFVRQLEQSQVFLFEFTPFQKRATAIKFNVAGLREKLVPLAESCGAS